MCIDNPVVDPKHDRGPEHVDRDPGQATSRQVPAGAPDPFQILRHLHLPLLLRDRVLFKLPAVAPDFRVLFDEAAEGRLHRGDLLPALLCH